MPQETGAPAAGAANSTPIEIAPGASVDFFSDADIDSQVVPPPETEDGGEEEEIPATDEVEQETEEEVEKEAKEGEEEKDEDKKEKQKRPVGRPKKGFDVRIGDKVERLSPETTITLKVDGRDQQVTLADLTSEFSGKTNWSTKHQELAGERKKLEVERKTFQTEQKSVNETIENMYKISVEKKDPRALIYYIADALGANGAEIWHNMLGQVRAQLKAAGVQVPEDNDPNLRAQRAEDESAYFKQRDQRKAQTEQQGRQQQVWETRTKKVQESFGAKPDGSLNFDDRALVAVYDKLVASGRDPSTITPELCGRAFAWDQATASAERVLKSLKTEVDKPEKAVQLLREAKLANPEFTDADLKLIASEVLGDLTKKVASTLSKKVRSGGGPAPRQPVPDKTPKKREAVFFDDLE